MSGNDHALTKAANAHDHAEGRVPTKSVDGVKLLKKVVAQAPSQVLAGSSRQ